MFEGNKGPGQAEKLDGSPLRVLIIHARWNEILVAHLVDGAYKKLLERGVKESNIVIQSVPGSWELPLACQRLFAASQVQAASLPSGDLLGGLGRSPTPVRGAQSSSSKSSGPFDSIIAIGILIKGDTMHFEYIAESVSQGLMRLQLDVGLPLVFGVLTVLDEEQAQKRAGLTSDGHNHGKDWGDAAVEMGVKRKLWAEGIIKQ